MFKRRLKHNDWNYSIRPDSSISLFSSFINTIISDYKACFPVQTIKLNYKNRNPWINQSLRNEIKIRDNLYMLSRKNPTIDNIKIYKTFKNRNLAKQRQAQRNYYKEQFQLNKTDLKKSWQLIKHIIGKEEGSHSIQLIKFVINKMYITYPKIIANSFNDYFINVGSSLANNINSNVDPLLYVQRHTNNMNIPEVSEFEIKNIIQDLNNSAAGYDELPASIFKKVSDIYIKPLTYFINMSIREGIVPEEFKLAKVIPIYEGEDDQIIQNYRPISVLPFLSKICEKIIFINVIEFLNENKLFYDCQFGFRKNHATSHAIITLTERVSKALDTGKIVVGVFLDLKKAFDTVDHNILLKKLEKYGIKGNILNWFKSYLSCRKQYVLYNNCKSDIKLITHGVPQGSILGPLLFIVYINDFSRASELLFSIIFDDDTSVFIEGTHYEQVISILNKELKKVDVWLQANKLTMNLIKTHYMVFHRSRIKHKYTHEVQIKGNVINHVCNTTFLGIIIDSKLNWTDHINHIKNKISKSIGIIYKIRIFLDKKYTTKFILHFYFPISHLLC